MEQKKVYDKGFKIQAVKFDREIGFAKAASELVMRKIKNWNVVWRRACYF